MKDVPVSEEFDDIYFSKEDGLAETAHVFLNGNDLPDAWTDKAHFTIFETGFGTGLNFFSVWKLFEETAKGNQRLDFISVEKYPLKPDEIRGALSHWADYFDERIDHFLENYPIRVAGFHRIVISERITLTLIFDDINDALPQVSADVDCWFLDGFTPAKNPDMWSEVLYSNMARLSVTGASYATFTAAGDVRRGLDAVGFSVIKQKGFGRKREMIAGKFKEQKTPSIKKQHDKKRVAVIGGGLAGTSCACVLKQYGFEPVIYEQGDMLGSGASGNSVGLYNPRFSKRRDNLSDFFAPAYAQLIRTAKKAGEAVDYNPCAALHLMNEANKAERYKSMAKNWLWHSDHVEILNAKQASEIAGVQLDYSALYLPDSGCISPQKLCTYYARDVEVHYNTQIDDLSTLDEGIVILACGGAVRNFEELSWLELETVRGQVSSLKQTEISKNLKCNLHYGSYISCAKDGVHSVGSTFEKWIEHTDVLQENHEENIQKLKNNISVFEKENFIIENGRAGMRAATNDRFPVIGAVPHHKNVYVSAAFGSHGIVASIAGGHLIADFVRGGPLSLPADTIYQLSPRRFIDRAAKKMRVLA